MFAVSCLGFVFLLEKHWYMRVQASNIAARWCRGIFGTNFNRRLAQGEGLRSLVYNIDTALGKIIGHCECTCKALRSCSHVAEVYSGVNSSWPVYQPPSAAITSAPQVVRAHGARLASPDRVPAPNIETPRSNWLPTADMSGRFKTALQPGLHSGAERRATTPVPPI